ncbi:MAG TPA: amino acid permease [Verrucomicrobiae bacterium]|jgi:amino acid transporter/nucleotide-binding universal stress UspA family protein|nr:amino acid permease [Verrucomicrobiae bacterium]
MSGGGVHRPRNVGWARAAAFLYGDWGTSKAYVIGFAFVAAQFASFPIILAVCAFTGLVGYNYVIVCKHFPDGGGVYSAAREQSRVLAVLGSLLLLADFIVTAALSGWDAMIYLGVPHDYVKYATLGVIVLVGFINYFGPKHSGSLAVSLAIPMVAVVILIIALSLPYLTFEHLAYNGHLFSKTNWVAFVGVILALSGVEAIANLTGVLKLDEGCTEEVPIVAKTAAKAIFPVAIEVVFGTALLGWAMLSLPRNLGPEITARHEDMLNYLGEHYGRLFWDAHMGNYLGWSGEHFGKSLSWLIGIVVGLLLLSAVNTAISAMIGLIYMLARDGEMPKNFAKLNNHGVPWVPLVIGVALPFCLTMVTDDLDSLADMYAIGVVGAIAVNLGSCWYNKKLGLIWHERAIMGVTFLILLAVEITIANTKHAALFFAVCVVGIGFALRAYSMKRAGLQTVTLTKDVAEAVSPEKWADMRIKLDIEQSIMVAARGITPVLKFALEEARFRKGALYVLYVKELAVNMPARIEPTERLRWQDDRRAAEIMYGMLDIARDAGVQIVPLYSVSENAAMSILDLSATLGIDLLILGASQRQTLASLLKGNVVTEVAKSLPENIQLVIHG